MVIVVVCRGYSMQLLRVFFSSCSKTDLQGYLSSSTLGCSRVEGVHSVMLYVVNCWKMCSLEKKILPNLLRELNTWKDAWKLYSSLSHLVHWAFMFTAEGCSTYCAVYLIKRAFLSPGKELGLKLHAFVLVGCVTCSEVSSAVWFSSLSHGPSHTCAEWIDGWTCAAWSSLGAWHRLLGCLRPWELESWRPFQWPLWMLGPHTETQVVCLWFSSWKKAHVTFPRALLGQFFEMHRMHSRFHSQQQQKLRVDSLGISGCWPLCIWPWMRHWYTTVPPCVPHALHPSLKEDVGLL